MAKITVTDPMSTLFGKTLDVVAGSNIRPDNGSPAHAVWDAIHEGRRYSFSERRAKLLA